MRVGWKVRFCGTVNKGRRGWFVGADESSILEVAELTHNMNCTSPLTAKALFPRTTILSLTPNIPPQANKPANRLVHLIHSIFRPGLQFTCYRYFYTRYEIVSQSAIIQFWEIAYYNNLFNFMDCVIFSFLFLIFSEFTLL